MRKGTNRVAPIVGEESFSVAAWVIAITDVIEALLAQVGIVQSVVEPAERALVF